MEKEKFLYLLPIGIETSSFLSDLGRELKYRFLLPYKVMETDINPAYAFHEERRQYNSMTILRRIIDRCPPDAIRILGVCRVDLFVPILTFVFGQAQLNGRAAVVSIARFEEEFYARKTNYALTFARTLKESMHELGHTFGLTHCNSPGCVMSLSMRIEQVDNKSADFCDRCNALLMPKLKKWRKL